VVWIDAILYISRTHGGLLGWHPQLVYERLGIYVEGSYFAGGMEGIWGFVDGTFCAFYCPAGNDQA
jgi:hypothetical protein